MSVQVGDLHPYQSFTLARSGEAAPSITDVLAQIRESLPEPRGGTRTSRKVGLQQQIGKSFVGFWHYENQVPVSWSAAPISDVLQHILVVVRRSPFYLFSTTDDRLMALLQNSIGAGSGALSKLSLCEAELLNAAFIGGNARTLWLAGVHRRTAVKADSKILSGVDLRDALDPLEDQTYTFTAARSTPTLGALTLTVGLSPRKAQLWIAASKNWQEYLDAAELVLDQLAITTTPNATPIPVLAVATTSLAGVQGAFDVAIAPPEVENPAALSAQVIQARRRWAEESVLVVKSTNGTNFLAAVQLGGVTIGNLDVSIQTGVAAGISVAIGGTAAPGKTPEFDELLSVLEDPRTLKVWYDSGHTLSEGVVAQMRLRDFWFRAFRWEDFAGYTVTQEKPIGPLTVASVAASPSLFGWIRARWPGGAGAAPTGWLACDDGSMEVADFVHINLTATPPILSLIHAKAAHKADPLRSLSLPAFEVVVAQALKNLRSLDRLSAGASLASGIAKKVSQLVWLNGNPSSRQAFLAALNSLGADYLSQVVILQPHAKKGALTGARAAAATSRAGMQARQLDTLLLSAQSVCRGLGSDLVVVGEA